MNEPMPECWLPVVNYPDYKVSSLARVWVLPRIARDGKHLKGHILRTSPGGQGYPVVSLQRDGVWVKRTVHSIVTEAFIGPRPEDMEVRHKDGVRSNATASNLEYGSSGDNERDKIRHGTHHYANRDACLNGHEFTRENTSIRRGPDGEFKSRVCLQCRRERYAEIAALKPWLPVVCALCGKDFSRPQTTGKNRVRYCSPECAAKVKHAQTIASQARMRAKRAASTK